MPLSTKTYALAAVSTVAIGLFAAYLWPQYSASDRYSGCRASNIAGAASIGGAFTLTDEDGRSVTDKDVLTKPSLVYFGYTFCPDICPTDTARNAEAVDALEEQGYEVTPIIISIDPDRDTPAVLKEWTDYVHPRMIGLTGTPDQIAAVAKQYRTYYKAPEDKSDEYYLVDHMTQTYLMLPDVGFVEFFNRDMAADDLANSVACFLGS